MADLCCWPVVALFVVLLVLDLFDLLDPIRRWLDKRIG